ncbi:hypothetical protein HZA96_05040 [Candidatus Woesearchaeota archaeon]|nr:hypothetical protein [Candidatus Woesearchaeota archaeon]
MVEKQKTATTHLLGMMFSPLFGREDTFDLELLRKKIDNCPLHLDLAALLNEINSQDSQPNGFLLDLPFPHSHLSLIKETLAELNAVLRKKKISPQEIPFIPSSSYEISNMRQWIATAFEFHLEYFFEQVSKGVSFFIPDNIDYKTDYQYNAYSTLGELHSGIEKFAALMQRRRNLESLNSFSTQRFQNRDLADNINLALYTRPNGRLKDNPIDAIIIRIKDFYESLPQKIARYWIDFLKGYNETKTVSGIMNRKEVFGSNDQALFIRDYGKIREVKLEDLLITDIFGAAIILNDSIKQRIEPANFYRKESGRELIDAREIVARTAEKHGYRRRISKLINPANGVMIDYHAIPSLDDYITAEFSSEKAHLIYAIRRHNSYIADKKYGKLYRAIYEAVKEIICEASAPSLQPNMLNYWRSSQLQDKALASLSQETIDFCSSVKK